MHEMGTLTSEILISRVWTEKSNRLHIEYRIGPFYDSNSILSMIKKRISAFHRHDCSPTLKLIYLPIITRHDRPFITRQVIGDMQSGFDQLMLSRILVDAHPFALRSAQLNSAHQIWL